MSSFSKSRRKFALGAAAAATTAIILPAQTIAQAVSPEGKPAAAPVEQATAAMAKLSPQARAEVEMKLADVLRKYGERLSDEQKADVRKVLAETQEGLEKMRAFVLENGDQPATVFHAWRSEGRSGDGERGGNQ